MKQLVEGVVSGSKASDCCVADPRLAALRPLGGIQSRCTVCYSVPLGCVLEVEVDSPSVLPGRVRGLPDRGGRVHVDGAQTTERSLSPFSKLGLLSSSYHQASYSLSSTKVLSPAPQSELPTTSQVPRALMPLEPENAVHLRPWLVRTLEPMYAIHSPI